MTAWLARREGRCARHLQAPRLGLLAPALLGRADPDLLPGRRATGDPRVKGAKYTIRYDQPIAVEESELPLRLPDLEDFRPGNDPAGPLARVPDWRFFQKDGKWFARETNTMPQWAGSCWYYLRFLDPQNDDEPLQPEALRRVDAGRPLRRRRRARGAPPALRALLAQGAVRPRAS